MRQGSPLVFAIVLNWNKSHATLACVEALSRHDYDNLHIIVVDNASTESSLEILSQASTPFLLIRNVENLGFAGGVNVGIRRALRDGADYVWLVNNDAIPEVSALSRLVAVMISNAKIGLSSPVILNANAGNQIEFCGGLWDKNTFHSTDQRSTYHQWVSTYPERIWLVGTALLLSRSLIHEIGLFNEKIFAYWEDNDYSIRSVKSGFCNVVVPDAFVYHCSDCTKTDAGPKPLHYYYYMARNEILFIKNHLSYADRVKPLIWAIEKQIRQIHRLEASLDAIGSIYGGLWDGFLGQGGAYRMERCHSPLVSMFLRKVARLYCG